MSDEQETNAEIVNDPKGNEVTKTNTTVVINFNFPFSGYQDVMLEWWKLFLLK